MKSYVSELGLSVGLGVLLCLLCSSVIDVAVAAQPGASGADDGDSYLRYVHPTIREPFVDFLNLGVPTELENQHLAALGYVDVTQRPFRAIRRENRIPLRPSRLRSCLPAITRWSAFSRQAAI